MTIQEKQKQEIYNCIKNNIFLSIEQHSDILGISVRTIFRKIKTYFGISYKDLKRLIEKENSDEKKPVEIITDKSVKERINFTTLPNGRFVAKSVNTGVIVEGKTIEEVRTKITVMGKMYLNMILESFEQNSFDFVQHDNTDFLHENL
jgi:archaellum component FlaF (FlaF/FlaG flagellin family)